MQEPRDVQAPCCCSRALAARTGTARSTRAGRRSGWCSLLPPRPPLLPGAAGTVRIRLVETHVGAGDALHGAAPPLRLGAGPAVSLGPDMALVDANLAKNAGRRLYRTYSGYVGVGPARTRPGDASVPLVLRRAGDDGAWAYVGEAYCDGLMDGEALGGRLGPETTLVLA